MSYAISDKSISILTKKNIPPKKSNVGKMISLFVNYQIKSVLRTDTRALAKWTKEELISLGPTFIKIGQFVSTRSDIFEKDVIEELKSLQDNTPNFSVEEAKQIIYEDFGCPCEEIFLDFSSEPIASASISQVHRAKLLSTGQEVVVKVQRPYIRGYFNRDFATLKTLLDFGDIFQHRGIQDTKLLLDDCYKYLYEELSFENEIKNIKMFEKIIHTYSEFKMND